MKKYIKPEIEIVSFDVESAVMAPADPTATPFPAMAANSVSALNTQYIPDSVDKKVWSTMDEGENWNWE